jgi:tripartite-type tricarboxylate transporter receptor subunit TctC
MGLPECIQIRLGIFAPKGIPQEVKDKWAEVLKTAVNTKEFKEFCDERASPAEYIPADQWKKLYEEDTEVVTQVLKEAQGK